MESILKLLSQILPRTIFYVIVGAITAGALTSCVTIQPSNTPIPLASPNETPGRTPESPTKTLEPIASKDNSAIILPSPTPAPTLTPGAISELVREFTRAQGLHEVTVFRHNVEDWLNLGFSILLTLVIGVVFSRLVYFVLKKITARTETKYDDLFVTGIRHQIYLVIITFGFQVGTVRLDLLEALVKMRVTRIYTLIYVVAATVILWRLVDVLVKWYQNEVEPKRAADIHQADTLLLLLHRFARALLITISLIMLLSLYNVNVTALIAALGVVGLAFSLAAQDTLSNVISGIMIMADQPFRVGDRIEISKLGTWGDVADIGLRSTRIRTSDNRLVIVPNNVISTEQVINYTFPDPRYRIQIELGIGYKEDIERVRQIIIDTVSQVEGVLADKPVTALIVNMGGNAMTIRVRWWIESYRDTRLMFDRVYTALLGALKATGIETPSDTYDINILNMPGAVREIAQGK